MNLRKQSPALLTVLVLMFLMTGCTGGDSGPKYYNISGTVIDEGTNAPLPNVRIKVEDIEESWNTDQYGQYELEDLKSGEITITIAESGYEEAKLSLTLTKNLLDHDIALISHAPLYSLEEIPLFQNGNALKNGDRVPKTKVRLVGNIADFGEPEEIAWFQAIVNGRTRDVEGYAQNEGNFDKELTFEKGENWIQLRLFDLNGSIRTGPGIVIIVD